jgi:hypothetical protein
MNEDGIPRALNVKVAVKCPLWRLRSRWKQQVKKDVTQKGGRPR